MSGERKEREAIGIDLGAHSKDRSNPALVGGALAYALEHLTPDEIHYLHKVLGNWLRDRNNAQLLLDARQVKQPKSKRLVIP